MLSQIQGPAEESHLVGRVSKGEHGTDVRTEPGLLTL